MSIELSDIVSLDILNISKRNLNPKIRVYLVLKNKQYFVNDGIIKNGFEPKLKISKNRESVLNAFSKMAFLFDELIRLRIIGYHHRSQSMELLYLLNLIPVNRKIRTFLDWKIFSPEYTRKMSRLFEVRNDTLHCISINEVIYNPRNPISLSNPKGYQKFKSDMQFAWKTLLEIYQTEQGRINPERLKEDLLK